MRAALDVLLAKGLPDVVLLTCGGRGVPMRAASYASERGLTVTARVADFAWFPVDAVERCDAFLVCEANAAVVGWADRDSDVRRVLALVERKGMPVHVLGGPEKSKARRNREPETADAARVAGLSSYTRAEGRVGATGVVGNATSPVLPGVTCSSWPCRSLPAFHSEIGKVISIIFPPRTIVTATFSPGLRVFRA